MVIGLTKKAEPQPNGGMADPNLWREPERSSANLKRPTTLAPAT